MSTWASILGSRVPAVRRSSGRTIRRRSRHRRGRRRRRRPDAAEGRWPNALLATTVVRTHRRAGPDGREEVAMTDGERQVLTAARRRRMGVQAAMADLESAIASPSTGRVDQWAKQVRESVARLREAFRHHVEVTESADGLFADVVTQAPPLAHQVDVLQAEHPRIEEALAGVAARLDAPGSVEPGAANEVADEILDVLGQIVRHRHAGASLVYEAYNVDIEAGD